MNSDVLDNPNPLVITTKKTPEAARYAVSYPLVLSFLFCIVILNMYPLLSLCGSVYWYLMRFGWDGWCVYLLQTSSSCR